MSIADKQILMRELEKRLGSTLTVDNMGAVMGILADSLTKYDVMVEKEDDMNSDSLDLLTAFLEAKTIEGCSPKTVTHYDYVLKKMIKEIGAPVRKVTIYHLRSYLMSMRKAGISDVTLAGHRYTFCSFFGWLRREGLVKDDPCENLSPIRCAKKVKLPFTDADIERLKESCVNCRDKALICFLLATGCRISEVCELDRGQVDLQNFECIVHGKGDKERTVFLDDVTAMLLKRYLSSRDDILPALFVGKGSKRLTPGGVRKMLHQLEEKSGVENVHPHRFRRTLATNLINRGMPIQEVAAILGHDKIDTTMTYIYIKEATVKNAYRKYA